MTTESELEFQARAAAHNKPQRVTIFPTPNYDGQFTLTDGHGKEAQEGYGYPTREAALAAAKQLWPANSVWQGKGTAHYGWSIVVTP